MNHFLKCTILLILFSCTNGTRKSESIQDTQHVVIISINGLDRKGLAETFERLSSCKPSAVGLMLLLDEPDSSDRSVAQSIKMLDNVVLATALEGDSIIQSNREISQNAVGSGFVQFALQNNKAVGHMMLHGHNSGVIWSFPLLILSHYDIDRAEAIFDSSEDDVVYRVPFNHSLDSFRVIQGSEIFDCQSLKGKVVLIGYTGSEGVRYSIDLESDVVEMDITTVMANTILHLLSNSRLEAIP